MSIKFNNRAFKSTGFNEKFVINGTDRSVTEVYALAWEYANNICKINGYNTPIVKPLGFQFEDRDRCSYLFSFNKIRREAA